MERRERERERERKKKDRRRNGGRKIVHERVVRREKGERGGTRKEGT